MRQGRAMREPSNRPLDIADGQRYCPSFQQVLPIGDFVLTELGTGESEPLTITVNTLTTVMVSG